MSEETISDRSIAVIAIFLSIMLGVVLFRGGCKLIKRYERKQRTVKETKVDPDKEIKSKLKSLRSTLESGGARERRLVKIIDNYSKSKGYDL